MNQRVIVILLVIIALGGAGFFFSQQSNPTVITQQETSPTPDYAMLTMYPSGTPTSAAGAGQYLPHTKNILNTVQGKKVVLFFYANWCPTCKPADEKFTQNVSMIPENVVVIRVNYNDTETDQDEKDLAKKYQITYQHTYVQIDENGQEVTKWNGGSLEELIANIK